MGAVGGSDDTLLSKQGITFEARAAGPGRRHVVSEIDVRRFVRCIPDWEVHSEGLRAIVLADGEDCLGMYDRRGILYLCSWDEDLFWQCEQEFFAEHEATLGGLGVPRDACEGECIPLYFDERSARAFQLVHVFLHELGHHRDRQMVAARKQPERGRRIDRRERSEAFAEAWALHMAELVWPLYKEPFGMPGGVRVAAKEPRVSHPGRS